MHLRPRSRATGLETTRSWDGGRLTLAQSFVLHVPVKGSALLSLLDSEMRVQSRRGWLRILQARGDHVYTLLGAALIRLGPPQVGEDDRGAWFRREIEGGVLARPGGVLEIRSLRPATQGTVLFSLIGFRPRLPRRFYALTQARVHERLVRQTVAHVVRTQRDGGGAPG